MAIARMGYVHARVTDLAEARKHYVETMGLYPTLEADQKIFLKGWDEWDHHSVVLEEGGVGVIKYGFKVEFLEDLELYEKRAEQFGVKTERMSRGENQEVGDGVRIFMTNGHIIELYHEMTAIGLETGTHNPEVFPRHLVGVGAPGLDHSLMLGSDVGTAERFFIEVFDFYPSERMVASLDDGAPLMATWLTAGKKVHDIAIIEGPDAKLHHFAFQLRDWSSIQHAADLFSMDRVSVDIGPTRHGLTRGETIYFFDPSGNRNEVFAGGYYPYRDRPTITWTADNLDRALDYYQREAHESFMNVHT
ncbi:catechol 2,3-dioxygenase [Nocardioides sp. YJ-D4]